MVWTYTSAKASPLHSSCGFAVLLIPYAKWKKHFLCRWEMLSYWCSHLQLVIGDHGWDLLYHNLVHICAAFGGSSFPRVRTPFQDNTLKLTHYNLPITRQSLRLTHRRFLENSIQNQNKTTDCYSKFKSTATTAIAIAQITAKKGKTLRQLKKFGSEWDLTPESCDDSCFMAWWNITGSKKN